METMLFLFFLFVIVPIIMIVQGQSQNDNNKDIKLSEKIGKSVSTYAHGVASEVSKLAQSITESDESKDKRKQIQLIHLYIEEAASGQTFYKRDELLDLYNDDSLKCFGISKKDWQNVITKAFAIGEISKKCVYKGKVNKNIPDWNKEAYFGTDWDNGKALRDALDYLGISKEDWIKWGYATLSMYEVNNEIDEFLAKIK